MKLVFTTHAVEQYQSRCAPHLSTPEALTVLKGMGGGIRRVGRAPSGGDLYIAADGTRLVLKFERGRFVVVTVVGPQGTSEWEIPDVPVAPVPHMDERDVKRRIAAYLGARARSGDKYAARLITDAQEAGVLE